MIINKGFKPKREQSDRLPPGQYKTRDFPVLSLGPTPVVSRQDWSLDIFGLANQKSWNWQEFNKLPMVDITTDIHCVTKWSKFDTHWKGVTFDQILKLVTVQLTANYLVAYSYDGYTTNIPLPDVINGQAIIAVAYDGQEISSEHGGPVRIILPHLYFWKSAKWLHKIEFVNSDQPGFWETRGYHNYGDPWKEQRYSFDD